MNREYHFKSKLAPYIKKYITLKKANGFLYNAEEYQLFRFDTFSFLHKELDNGIISRDLVSLWSVQLPTECTNTRNYRISYVRLLAVFMNSIGIDSYIPIKQRSSCVTIPYIPSLEELQIFFKYIDKHKLAITSIKAQQRNIIYPILFRLLYCCGMRLAEACNIKRINVNLNTKSLLILCSKGDKDRKIYMSSDLCIACKIYDERMNKWLPNREWFFPDWNHIKAIPKTTIDKIFHQYWMEAFPKWTGKIPTPHCLRHAFTINRMTLWMESGVDLNTKMPYLSKYLGHKSIEETFYYYHNLESIFPFIKNKDIHSSKIIPEVMQNED